MVPNALAFGSGLMARVTRLGWDEERHFAGINPKRGNLPENAQTPTSGP